jgi:hypothetical protein
MRKFVTAGVAAAIASAGLVGLSSAPAAAVATVEVADTWCRTPYTQGEWRAQPCVDTDDEGSFRIRGRLSAHPSNCRTWKLIAYNQYGEVVRSTSPHSCSTVDLATPWFDSSDFIQARLVAYNASGTAVLSIDSPFG